MGVFFYKSIYSEIWFSSTKKAWWPDHSCPVLGRTLRHIQYVYLYVNRKHKKDNRGNPIAYLILLQNTSISWYCVNILVIPPFVTSYFKKYIATINLHCSYIESKCSCWRFVYNNPKLAKYAKCSLFKSIRYRSSLWKYTA